MSRPLLLPLSKKQIAYFMDGIYGLHNEVIYNREILEQDSMTCGDYTVSRLSITLSLPMFRPTDLHLIFCLPLKQVHWCESPQTGRT